MGAVDRELSLDAGTVYSMTIWQTAVGTQGTRDEFKALYGGEGNSGIQTPSNRNNILVYSDRLEGKKYGYDLDGWNEDGTVFSYTGQGSVGDQVLTSKNRILDEQRQSGIPIRLFVAVGKVPNSGKKIHRYLGEFQVDESSSHSVQRNVDRFGVMRKVYVFNLCPIHDVEVRDEDFAPTLEVDDASAGYYEVVPLARNTVTNFERSSVEASVAEKREEDLVERFEQYLRATGRDAARFKIYPPGSKRPLFTDLCDMTSNVLYEAKAGAGRGYVREALGQILDYRRFVDEDVRCRVLLPDEPAPDLVSLLLAYGVGVVWPGGEGEFNLHEPNEVPAK